MSNNFPFSLVLTWSHIKTWSHSKVKKTKKKKCKFLCIHICGQLLKYEMKYQLKCRNGERNEKWRCVSCNECVEFIVGCFLFSATVQLVTSLQMRAKVSTFFLLLSCYKPQRVFLLWCLRLDFRDVKCKICIPTHTLTHNSANWRKIERKKGKTLQWYGWGSTLWPPGICMVKSLVGLLLSPWRHAPPIQWRNSRDFFLHLLLFLLLFVYRAVADVVVPLFSFICSFVCRALSS